MMGFVGDRKRYLDDQFEVWRFQELQDDNNMYILWAKVVGEIWCGIGLHSWGDLLWDKIFGGVMNFGYPSLHDGR